MARISTGSTELNSWLHGGYETGVMSVMYGPAGSGKTNFCLLAAVSQARKGKHVIYVDTEGGFSSERVKQIAGEQTEQVLEHLFLLTPTTFAEQKQAFEQLLKHVQRKDIGLIVVDGITMLYRLDAAAARVLERMHEEKESANKNERGKERGWQEVNAALVEQLRTLAELARKRDIPVLVTNQTYRWGEEERMVAGDILRYWGKCQIELTQEGGRRVVHLRKHRSLPESSFPFQIVHEGIRKRRWW